MTDPVYIAGIGMITALGDSPELVDAAVQAGISAHARSDYLTADKHSITMSLVPEDALPELEDGSAGSYLDLRNKRLLRMCLQAAGQALADWHGERPLPLLLAATEAYPEIDVALDRKFIRLLAQHGGYAFDDSLSQIFYSGRVGVIQAIETACSLIHRDAHPAVLVGGVDSSQYSALVALLDRDDRLRAQRTADARVRDAYIAGEGAAFLLLTAEAEAAINNGRCRVAVNRPGFGFESGHFYGDQPNLGDGMDRAFKQALEHDGETIDFEHLYSSMNGESFWAREVAVAMTRNHGRLRDSQLEHPADCYGDLGAASAAVLIALAQARMLDAQADNARGSLVCCAADQGLRAAISLRPERFA